MVNFLLDLVRTGDTVVLFQVIGLLVAAAAASYLCGCFNGAVIVSKYILRNDVRNHGSGNAGLTNFYRVFGGPLTVVVILTDAIKMVAAGISSRWGPSARNPRASLSMAPHSGSGCWMPMPM